MDRYNRTEMNEYGPLKLLQLYILNSLNVLLGTIIILRNE